MRHNAIARCVVLMVSVGAILAPSLYPIVCACTIHAWVVTWWQRVTIAVCCGVIGNALATWCMNAREDRGMGNTWWKVTLRADGGRYAHLVVRANTEEDAIKQACNIELAPRRSVVKVATYEGAEVTQ